MSRPANLNYTGTITLTLDVALHAPDRTAARQRLEDTRRTLAYRLAGNVSKIGGGSHLTGDPEIVAVDGHARLHR